MGIDQNQYKEFLAKVEQYLITRIEGEEEYVRHENSHLKTVDCFFILDLTKNEIVYHQGFDKVFGYILEKVDINFILEGYHPLDAPMVQAIAKALLSQLVSQSVPEFSNMLNMAYRFRKADGTYARIMSNTIVYQTDANGRVMKALIRYTDISFAEETEAVEWNVNSEYIDYERMKEQVYGKGNLIFTLREAEIIGKIFEDLTNLQIAVQLHISQHTVATHRKNILTKSNCHNVGELKEYCRKRGIDIGKVI